MQGITTFVLFPQKLKQRDLANQLLTISQLRDLVSRTHCNVIVNDMRLCVHKNVGSFKFGDLVAHRQTAKLNLSPTFLCLWYMKPLLQEGLDTQVCS